MSHLLEYWPTSDHEITTKTFIAARGVKNFIVPELKLTIEKVCVEIMYVQNALATDAWVWVSVGLL